MKNSLVERLARKTEEVRAEKIPFPSMSEEEQFSLKWLNRLLLETTYPKQCPETPEIVLEALNEALNSGALLPACGHLNPEFKKEEFG